jgi:hypothetical protein
MALSPNTRLKAKHYRKHVLSPIPKVDALIRALDGLKPSPRLPADLLSDYRSTLKKLKRWALHIKRLNMRRDASMTIVRWQLRNGARLANTTQRNAQLAWLLNVGKRNVHAVALGKLGAAARWQKHRERKALLVLEDAHV